MKDDLSSLSSLLQETRNLVAFHRHCELDYPLSPELKSFLNPSSAKIKTQPFSPTPMPAAATAKPVDTVGPDTADRQTLDDLRLTLESCQLCPPGTSRQQMIFGEGPARQGLALLIISDPPGAEEAAANRPISGAPRELLKKMLGAINLSLDDIFLTNIVKCVPPEGSTTTAGTSACLPFLIRQIELIKPKIICTMGQTASQTLLKTSQSLLSLRGRFHDFQGIPLMPTFHPTLLLRTQELKKGAWHDLQMIQKKLKSLP
ncbi:MAG: uracil-DNA glycosylase [Proteobacteria bacterium]|nr:uracil-DNA glycosylase [Pseudomonadota bacterium]MBU4294423.1 uracil-DNA glycosylase [Pseudomonadota bacterium]MCG2747605.1 uracil-DNA glycosylase [Desulfobulbaceae bacterium]